MNSKNRNLLSPSILLKILIPVSLGVFLLPGYWFEAISLPVCAFFITCLYYGPKKGRQFLFPCFYLIFFYPIEWKMSFMVQPLNQLQTFMVGQLFKMLGFSVNLYVETCRLQVSSFTMDLIPRCSGLDLLILLVMFLPIYAWRSPLSNVQKFCWTLTVIPAAILSNILRIFLITLAGTQGLQSVVQGPLHNIPCLLTLFGLAALLNWEKSLLMSQKNYLKNSC